METKKHSIQEYQKDGELDIDRLMDDLSQYIKTIINNMTNNNISYEDKEEILSDVFFVIWKNKDKIDSTVEAYASGITRILVKEKLRKRKILENIEDYENLVSEKNSLNLEDDIHECECVSKCIKNLKEIDILILNYFYYHSKTTKEIAIMLNVSEINVRCRLFRLRNKIRKEISDKGGV